MPKLGTKGKWENIEIPDWWSEDFQKEHPNPLKEIYLFGEEMPFWRAGFSAIKPRELPWQKMQLHKAILEADKWGFILMEEIGFDKSLE